MIQRGIHKVTLDTPPIISTILATEMKAGQYGEIVASVDHSNEGRIIGRSWTSLYSQDPEACFFALDNPRSTWTKPTFSIRLLEPGEIIHVVVGK